MKLFLCLSALALAFAAPAQAAKPAKLTRIKDCRATAAAISLERGVTVYRAKPRPWRQDIKPEPVKAPAARIVVRSYRYNYLSVDTRPRGEWGVVNAVYQKF